MTITASGWELFNRVSDLGKILGALCGKLAAVTISAAADGTDDGRVTVRGRCDGAEVELSVSARVVEPGEAAASFDCLARALAPFVRRKVTMMSADELFMYVTCGNATVTLETCATDSAPCVPSDKVTHAVFESGDFLDAMSDVIHAQSDDYACRRSLCGIQFEVGTDMKLRAIATDGGRLAVATRQICYAELNSPVFAVFLPRAATEFLARAFYGETITVYKLGKPTDSRVGIAIGGNYGEFVNDVSFPEWRQCVPKDPPLRATFDASEVSSALRDAIAALDIPGELDEDGDPLETKLYGYIRATGSSATLEVSYDYRSGLPRDAPKLTANLNSFTTPDDAKFEACINPRYLRDVVCNRIGTVEVYAGMLNENQIGPLVFKFPNELHARPADAIVVEVVMPIRTC